MKEQSNIDLDSFASDLERHRTKEDEFVDRSNFARKNFSELGIQDEFFNTVTSAQKLKNFNFERLNGVRTNGLSAIDFHKGKFGRCNKCKEWTEVGNSCCGEDFVHVD